MPDLDLSYTPATRLAALIREKKLSPVEVIENSLARIAEVDRALNCFCFTYPEEALEKARAAEAAVMAGAALGPLHGVPIAIKDLTPTAGKRTTRGSFIHEHDVPDADAIVVERLLAAGAILVGKTTTPEYAFSWFTDSLLWGVTRNPWNPSRTPGGSSGGSAAAVATGCVPLAEGSDMGGSVRVPAAFCGLTGLKPSFGRIPFEIFPSVFDQTCHFGPLARTVDDAALFLDVAHGPDQRDIQTLPQRLDIDIPVPSDIRGRRLAFSMDLGHCRIDDAVAANTRAAVEVLRDLGAVVEEIDLALPIRPETGWGHWGVYYAALLGDRLAEWRGRMDPSLVEMIEKGLATDAVTAKKWEYARTRHWQALAPLFERHDALLCPTAAIPAPDAGLDDGDFDYFDDDGRYVTIELTSHFNMVGQCPAFSVPSGWTGEGLPTGLQIVGNRFDDLAVLRIGAALEGALRWTEKRPPI